MSPGERAYFAALYRWLVATRVLNVDLSGPRLLDAGCDDASFLRRSSAAIRVGVDIAPRAHAEPPIEIVRADLGHLPLKEANFDAVLLFDVLEHIEHDQRVMGELLRVLRPTGSLWFSTPARDTTIWPRFLHPRANRAFGHVRNGYNFNELQALLPNQERWTMELFYWNEPLLRAAFIPLHILDRFVPRLAAPSTVLCFKLDKYWSHGSSGHIFGRIVPRSRDKVGEDAH